MLENKKSVTNTQLTLLLEQLENDPTLGYERILNGKKSIHNIKWNQLVEKLNAVPNGAKRSVLRWKTVLSNWKLTLKKQLSSNENVGNPEIPDEMGKRLLRLIEEEELVRDIQVDLLSNFTDADTMLHNENHNGFLRPQRRLAARRLRSTRAGPFMSQPRGTKSLKTIYDNNVDRDGSPERKIMQKQLDRLHSVSQQLEIHIQDVQNRIQMIKDMWHHECIEE